MPICRAVPTRDVPATARPRRRTVAAIAIAGASRNCHRAIDTATAARWKALAAARPFLPRAARTNTMAGIDRNSATHQSADAKTTDRPAARAMAAATDPMATAPAISGRGARPRLRVSSMNCRSASGAATANGIRKRMPSRRMAMSSATIAAVTYAAASRSQTAVRG